MGPYGKTEEGVVVVEGGNRFRMVPSPLDMTHHVRKRRIRITETATAAVESVKIVMGDVMTEVDDESILGGG